MTDMQSADEEWDDEDWEDDDSDFSGFSLSFGIKPVLVTAFVVLLLISSMIFTNFGFYYGAGSLSVLIDVNEGKDTSDKDFNFNILATSPIFNLLKTV